MTSLQNLKQWVMAQFNRSTPTSQSKSTAKAAAKSHAQSQATATTAATAQMSQLKPQPRKPILPNQQGVTIYPAPHGAHALPRPAALTTTPLQLLAQVSRSEVASVKDSHVIQSSFTDLASDPEEIVYGSHNGFVDTCVQAYNSHFRLVIRPDDVWFAILAQLNIYINAHAEELRGMFVSHEGQKKLAIEANETIAGKAMMGVDYGKFSYKMSQLLAANLKDPTLLPFFLPQFTTTTKVDQAVASIMMMSSMKKYFTYSCYTLCGLPSVTLLGQRSDWEKLLEKVERIPSFGKECVAWHSLLLPVLKRFVTSFEDPDSQETKDFWQKIVHYDSGGSGPTYLSGWITAFTFWDIDGVRLHQPPTNPRTASLFSTNLTNYVDPYNPVLELDSVRYHRIETDQVAPGWASVPVELDDNGVITKCVMVAGLAGTRASSSGQDLHFYWQEGKGEKTGLDVMSVESGWLMYEAKESEGKEIEGKGR